MSMISGKKKHITREGQLGIGTELIKIVYAWYYHISLQKKIIPNKDFQNILVTIVYGSHDFCKMEIREHIYSKNIISK